MPHVEVSEGAKSAPSARINKAIRDAMANNNIKGKVRLMFQDEAGFGRINKPKYCWCYPGLRPVVPSQHIREYRYAYGAIDPLDGDSFFLVLPYSNTDCMNIFLDELSKTYPDDYIIMPCDQATWHRIKSLITPNNIQIFYLPPATPELNPIEQIWRELRKSFKNELFKTLNDVVDRLCQAIRDLTKDTIISITGRDWILGCF